MHQSSAARPYVAPAPSTSRPHCAPIAARVLLALCTAALMAGCGGDTPTDLTGVRRDYGAPVSVGNGNARSYVAIDQQTKQPTEIGIALDAKAFDGLPTAEMAYSYLLPLPSDAPAPYRLVELDWNPNGHEPQGVYDVPHFDFHFYRITLDQRNAIVPSDPDFAAKASNVPTGDSVPPFYVVPGPPADVAVPQMGVHWSDVRSPELQKIMGHPENYQDFTKTFIYGSWDGAFTFLEPMVTREYLLTKPDVTTPIPVPQEYPEPGYYPTAYTVTYDAQANEYRVALTGLTQAQ